MHITIFEQDAQKAAKLLSHINRAMNALGLKGLVHSITEAPILAREGLLGQLPTIKIDDKFWNMQDFDSPDYQQCLSLLQYVVRTENGKKQD